MLNEIDFEITITRKDGTKKDLKKLVKCLEFGLAEFGSFGGTETEDEARLIFFKN